MLERLETKVVSPGTGNELSDTHDILNHVVELKDMLQRERTDYHVRKLVLSGAHAHVSYILGYLVHRTL